MRLELLAEEKPRARWGVAHSLVMGLTLFVLLASSQVILGLVLARSLVAKAVWAGLCAGLAAVLARVLVRIRLVR